jgi:hypothetical protein
MRERRAGVWELIVQLPREPSRARARARQMSRSVHGTKREAQRALAALVAEVSTGKVTAASETLGELLARWLDLVAGHLSPTTVREYRRLVDTMLTPDLGKLTLRRVTTQRLDAYYGSLLHERNLSPASIRHVHAVLRKALGQAVKWGLARSEPGGHGIAAEGAPSRDHPAGHRRCPGPARGRRRARPGARRPAAGHGRHRGPPRRGLRAGLVGRRLRRRHHRHPLVDRIDRRWFNPVGFVFTHAADGSRPLHPDTVTSGFRRVCLRLGIEGVRLHDLRHLHATQLLAAGMPARTVSGRLGHANAGTTLNVYAHFLQASDRDAADVMGGLLEAPPKNSR